MLAPALSIDRLCIRFGSRIAVDDLTLDVAAGEAFALLGGNGSGKSTTLSVAAGIRQATSGTVRVMGDTRADNPDRYARRVGYVPQDLALYDELTAADNLALFGGLYGMAGRHLRTRAAEALAFVGLADGPEAFRGWCRGSPPRGPWQARRGSPLPTGPVRAGIC